MSKTTAKQAYAQGVKDFDKGIDFSNPPKNYSPLLIELWEQGWVDKEMNQVVIN